MSEWASYELLAPSLLLSNLYISFRSPSPSVWPATVISPVLWYSSSWESVSSFTALAMVFTAPFWIKEQVFTIKIPYEWSSILFKINWIIIVASWYFVYYITPNHFSIYHRPLQMKLIMHHYACLKRVCFLHEEETHSINEIQIT